MFIITLLHPLFFIWCPKWQGSPSFMGHVRAWHCEFATTWPESAWGCSELSLNSTGCHSNPHLFVWKKKRIPCTVLFRAPAVNDFGCLTLSAVHSHRHTHCISVTLVHYGSLCGFTWRSITAVVRQPGGLSEGGGGRREATGLCRHEVFGSASPTQLLSVTETFNISSFQDVLI